MTDIAISKRRRRKREISPDIDRRTAAPFNDHRKQMRAARQLAHVRSVLGTVGYDLCRSVIAGGLIMEQLAAAAGNSSQRSIDFWARRFRECLQTLANTICRVCLDFGRARRRAAS